MYSESDIEQAVATGAITRDAATALRESVARSRATPLVDEESFRLITGFNDIFVTIAALLLLVALGWIGFSLAGPDESGMSDTALSARIGYGAALSGLLVAAGSWGLAEYFTARRRMALPSIVLLGTFVYGFASGLFALGVSLIGDRMHDAQTLSGISLAVALLTAAATYAHWRRFQVPITIAALTTALAAAVMAALLCFVPRAWNAVLWLLLAAGIGLFAFAMWWDMSDRTRQTRRSDVAFWLHLAAAPMIAHPIFNLLGVLDNQVSAMTGLMVILLYVAFGIVALAIDRRALLVSSLVYVLYAIAGLFRQAGAVSLNVALTALVIGSALLLLSAFWHNARRRVVLAFPSDLQDRLPALDRQPSVTPRPA